MFSFIYVKLFIYITAGFIGFMNIAFLVFLAKNKSPGNSVLYRATRNFTFSALLLVVMYFIFLFMRFVFGELDNNAMLRVFDILAFLGMKYFWLKIVLGIIGVGNKSLHRMIDAIFVIFTALCVFNFGFLMDSQYYVADDMIRNYVITVSVLLSIIPFAINLYLIIKFYRQIITKLDKKFIIMLSILIHLNAWWNGMMAIRLYSGEMVLTTWLTPITDPTSILVFLINLGIFIFIYQKDFSPLFKLSTTIKKDGPRDLTNQEKVDLIAYKHALTVREREVTLLVYKGYSNPDIADQLFISRNTVRNHIHNIFYKLDVSSRLDLIHLINSMK